MHLPQPTLLLVNSIRFISVIYLICFLSNWVLQSPALWNISIPGRRSASFAFDLILIVRLKLVSPAKTELHWNCSQKQSCHLIYALDLWFNMWFDEAWWLLFSLCPFYFYLLLFLLSLCLIKLNRVMPNICPLSANTVLVSLNTSVHATDTPSCIPEIVVIVVHIVRQHFHVGKWRSI